MGFVWWLIGLLCGCLVGGLVVWKIALGKEDKIEGIEGLREAEEGLRKAVKDGSVRLEELKGKEEALKVTIEKLNDEKWDLDDVVTDLNDQVKWLKDNCVWLERDVGKYVDKLNEVKDELEKARLRCDAIKKVEAKDEEGRLGWIELSSNEKNLVELLDEVKKAYPTIAGELAMVAWKRIWLPAMQTLVKEVGADGVRGIYRLEMKDGRSYVGQSVNIKERWYTHAKKMLGLEASGNEKLYKAVGRPDEVKWEVIEAVDGDLNEAERYWIEWFGSELNVK